MKSFIVDIYSLRFFYFVLLLFFRWAFRNALDLLPTTVFPNFPPGGHIDDENNRKAIEALKNAKEYTIINEEDALQQESILSKLPVVFSL